MVALKGVVKRCKGTRALHKKGLRKKGAERSYGAIKQRRLEKKRPRWRGEKEDVILGTTKTQRCFVKFGVGESAPRRNNCRNKKKLKE